MRKGKWLFIAVGLIGLATVGVYALSNFVRMREGSESACAEYLTGRLGRTVTPHEVEASLPEVFFPSRFDKRFRSTCTFEGTRLWLESTPLKDWRVVRAEGID